MMIPSSWSRFFPFLRWFPVSTEVLRVDLIAGITGGLVLVPKAMAYAQLAGLPVYTGLCAAFVPAIIAALWGSSRQLLTGPVAVVSLMTASALTPFAVAGTDDYVMLALLLALLVGIMQMSMGLFKLGVIVNFISQPVIVGFINAAAIIIALSQFNKLLGIPLGRSDSFLRDIWEMLGHIGYTHFPTLAMGLLALIIIVLMKKVTNATLARTGVLVAVVVTTVLSAAIGFEHNRTARPEQVVSPTAHSLLRDYVQTEQRIRKLSTDVTEKSTQLRELRKNTGEIAQRVLAREYDISLLKLEAKNLEQENLKRLLDVRALNFEYVPGANNSPGKLYLAGQVPPALKTDAYRYHIKTIDAGEMQLLGGGEVVGKIPSGLPSLSVPTLKWDQIVQLLAAAFVIAMVAFMESISMAKALSTQTKQRVDANQELIGQGLANIGGSFFQSYPTTGSFSGSAINLEAGARTGLASVFNGLFVGVTLLFLTSYLYHLPQAVLSVIIIMAVASLIHLSAIKRAWLAHRNDGIVAATSFALTLVFAPHLDQGVLAGAGLALVLYLYRTMQPRVAVLARHPDGTLRDAEVFKLEKCDTISMIRFDGSLYFANTGYFEDKILERVSAEPDLKYVIVVGDGINQVDATGEEMLAHLAERLSTSGIEMIFTGLKKQVMDVFRRTGFYDKLGPKYFFRSEEAALTYVWEQLGNNHAADCPLNIVRPT